VRQSATEDYRPYSVDCKIFIQEKNCENANSPLFAAQLTYDLTFQVIGNRRTESRSRSAEQFFQRLLPVLECLLKAGCNKKLLSQVAQDSKADVVLNHVAHRRPSLAVSRLT
jgi:hypothetical protein